DSRQAAAAMHPAHDERAASGIGRAELAAGVGALQIAEKIEWDACLHSFVVGQADSLPSLGRLSACPTVCTDFLGDFWSRDVYLFAGLHVLQRVLTRRNLVIADEQRVAGALLVRQLHRARQLSFRRELDTEADAAQVARQDTRVAERGIAERRDEQLERGAGLRLLDRHHQPVLANR